jgi:hypothetical protein
MPLCQSASTASVPADPARRSLSQPTPARWVRVLWRRLDDAGRRHRATALPGMRSPAPTDANYRFDDSDRLRWTLACNGKNWAGPVRRGVLPSRESASEAATPKGLKAAGSGRPDLARDRSTHRPERRRVPSTESSRRSHRSRLPPRSAAPPAERPLWTMARTSGGVAHSCCSPKSSRPLRPARTSETYMARKRPHRPARSLPRHFAMCGSA